jgi:2,4-dienoyl-CoA reductase-like NADH-dependent reductase (Old Yellow Enzyme family)
MPVAMTEDEIWMIVEAFARAAGRAKESGFTGIELHGANTYLFQQFFSPFTNKRTDKWGGDLRCDRCDRHDQHDRLELCHRLENRARFAMEVIKAVRTEVGSDYPVAYRISPEEPDPDGYSAHDAIQLLGLLVPLGIDIVHVSSWDYGKALRSDYTPGSHPTRMIRDSLPAQIPVIGVGKIVHPDQAIDILDDDVDLVALGRALLLDADWASKVREGRVAQIRSKLTSEDDRRMLDIPAPMREYTKHSIPISN